MEKIAGRKKRLDLLLVEKGLVNTRSRARGEIMAGHVFLDGKRQDKAGLMLSSDALIELQEAHNPYVSRGGIKLEKALHEFNIQLRDKIVLDIGASTGGFTHSCLEHGAKKVYALDVGYGQLDWILRNDERVINLERKNARFIKRENFSDKINLVTIDVSFISLALILPVIAAFPVQEIICLIKPQFEAAPYQVQKKGVIKDPGVHREILCKIMNLAGQLSYQIAGLTHSPLKGPKGNIEYLLYLKHLVKETPPKTDELDKKAFTTVSLAFQTLGTGDKKKEHAETK